ncbi:MAG TPA: hypothetical protein VGD71_37490 [Kribbella sp.]|jgi:hypothetical protein
MSPPRLSKRCRWRFAAATVMVGLATAGCTTEDPGPTYSTLGVSGEMLCGFVPKADVVAAVGTSALTTDGSLLGRGGTQPLQDSGCFVRTASDKSKIFEVVVWDREHDDGYTEWLLKNPEPNQTLFPAGHPIGVANPAYGSRVDGKKTGELRTGAVATAIIGDWYINLRIYQPGKGRNAVTDAINLVQRVSATLQLPTQATRTYPPYVPSTPTPRPPSPSATPTN